MKEREEEWEKVGSLVTVNPCVLSNQFSSPSFVISFFSVLSFFFGSSNVINSPDNLLRKPGAGKPQIKSSGGRSLIRRLVPAALYLQRPKAALAFLAFQRGPGWNKNMFTYQKLQPAGY